MAGKSSDTAAGFGCLIVLVVGGIIVWGTYTALDQAGWVSHKKETTITAQAGWIAGESKDCYAVTIAPQNAKLFGGVPWSAIYSIHCDDGPLRTMEVTFWGQTERENTSSVGWKCTRTSDSFVCRATW